MTAHLEPCIGPRPPSGRSMPSRPLQGVPIGIVSHRWSLPRDALLSSIPRQAGRNRSLVDGRPNPTDQQLTAAVRKALSSNIFGVTSIIDMLDKGEQSIHRVFRIEPLVTDVSGLDRLQRDSYSVVFRSSYIASKALPLTDDHRQMIQQL